MAARVAVFRRRTLVAACVGLAIVAGLLALWLQWKPARRVKDTQAAARRPVHTPEGPEDLARFAAAAERALSEGRLSAAEQHLRRVLQSRPGDLRANQYLARLLRLEGRRWESLPLFLELARQDACDVEELVLLAGIELAVYMPEDFRRNAAQLDKDPLMLLWEAQEASGNDEPAQAETLLRRVIALAPEQIEAQARLGSILLESPDSAAWANWHSQLPPAADLHPEIWFVRGVRAQNDDEPRAAARCFGEALRRDPDHRAANYRLSQVLTSLEQSDRAKPFLERARKLQELEADMYVLDLDHDDLDRMRHVVELTESLGRLYEARAWCRVALRRDPRLVWARTTIDRLRPLLDASPPRVLDSLNPSLRLDLSSFPLPEWKATFSVADHPTSTKHPPISFEDVAPAAGMHFTYFNGGIPEAGTLQMYEATGGGVAILDYDQDGWPDVYLTQGCAWPPEHGQKVHLDCLYRNLGQGQFQEVTAAAQLGDERFSQGATVGDFDNDGFADVYVANIGRNRLYHNQGDGTFTDVTDVAGAGGGDWNTSCLMADLNGDSHPDIYAVTYLAGDDVFTRTCHVELKGGVAGSCPPRVFPAEPDRLYLSNGDGHFEDVSETAGIAVPDGKGLGIVAADFDGSGKLNVFVANDTVPNFYFVNQTVTRGGTLRFAERAPVVGLAYDMDGLAKAGMGIVAGDVDGDGLLDLVVTNYYHEASTLYRQQPAGLFIDDTRRSGLREPSLAALGWGAQFLDADLDGLPDLVVANGHTDNYAAAGQPYRMRPQFFRNTGGGRFQELSFESLGSYFQGAHLGRGLARLDWNRDGREDFVVSHLDAPVALLSNRTIGAGHFLARLRQQRSATTVLAGRCVAG